jgi:hypothetical protein
LRARCAARARECYSQQRYGEQLQRVLDEAAAAGGRHAEPLRPSAFAEEFWATCIAKGQARCSHSVQPRYRHGPEALQMYRELITPFAARPSTGSNGHASRAWCLPAPLLIQHDIVAVNDPIFPLEITVPPHLANDVRTLASRFAERPVMPDAALAHLTPLAREALVWMHDAGLLLRTSGERLDMEQHARGGLGRPVFDLRKVDARTDVMWLS